MVEHITAEEPVGPPECWIRKYRTDPNIPQKDPLKMSVDEIKEEISTLLFDPDFRKKAGATDRELLTIVILSSKAHFFDFLKAYTDWRTRGMWEGVAEPNLEIEVEFRDTPTESLGNRLMHLLWAYNIKVVKEEVLYVRTSPIEEGTLFP